MKLSDLNISFPDAILHWVMRVSLCLFSLGCLILLIEAYWLPGFNIWSNESSVMSFSSDLAKVGLIIAGLGFLGAFFVGQFGTQRRKPDFPSLDHEASLDEDRGFSLLPYRAVYALLAACDFVAKEKPKQNEKTANDSDLRSLVAPLSLRSSQLGPKFRSTVGGKSNPAK